MFFFSPISGKLFDEGYFTSLLRSSSVLYVFWSVNNVTLLRFKFSPLINSYYPANSQFMLSATKPHKFYQVFLVQGIGLGLSAGMMFLPSVSIVAHYFSVRRSLIMGIVIAGLWTWRCACQFNFFLNPILSGSSLGGIVMPILLNQLFNNSRVGFAWGVRYAGLLLFSILF